MTTLTVEDLRLQVRRSDRRRTVEITVDRDGDLIVSAPMHCAESTMEAFVRKKRFWIYSRLAEKELHRATPSKSRYAPGERFPFLGKMYRLLLVEKQNTAVKLIDGRFKMSRSNAPEGRQHMIEWYSRRARPWLARSAQRMAGRFGVRAAMVTVQDLGFRWGSCGGKARLYFHWKTILLPPSVAEYVVAHELVHLREPHHTPRFWLRLERAMPDFAVRKRWLLEKGPAWTAL